MIQQHGDGVYAVHLFPSGSNDWTRVGLVSVKNLDKAGAPDCDMGEWALSVAAMKDLGLDAELPLPEGASVRLDFVRKLEGDLIFADIVAELYRIESGQVLAREDFNMFRVVSFRKAL